MHDQNHRPKNPRRPEPAVAISEPQSHALHRRQSLDQQQRGFQGAYPPPHLNRHRPPG